MLEARGLAKRYGGVVVNDAVDLMLAPGETLALIGPNGAGKTTLIGQLAGSIVPDAGRILLGGEDVTRLAIDGRARRGLARSHQVTSVFAGLTVLDNLVLAYQAMDGTSMRFWRARESETALTGAACSLASRLGLQDRLASPAGRLSHGEQRQLEVGLALAARPRVLLLDEPMAGLGPDESHRMVALIESLKADMAILLVEHDMGAVFRLADRIAVMVAGRIIAADTPEAIRADERVQAAYLGSARR